MFSTKKTSESLNTSLSERSSKYTEGITSEKVTTSGSILTPEVTTELPELISLVTPQETTTLITTEEVKTDTSEKPTTLEIITPEIVQSILTTEQHISPTSITEFG